MDCGRFIRRGDVPEAVAIRCIYLNLVRCEAAQDWFRREDVTGNESRICDPAGIRFGDQIDVIDSENMEGGVGEGQIVQVWGDVREQKALIAVKLMGCLDAQYEVADLM